MTPQELVRKFEESGKSIHDFCVEQIINEGSFTRMLAEIRNGIK